MIVVLLTILVSTTSNTLHTALTVCQAPPLAPLRDESIRNTPHHETLIRAILALNLPERYMQYETLPSVALVLALPLADGPPRRSLPTCSATTSYDYTIQSKLQWRRVTAQGRLHQTGREHTIPDNPYSSQHLRLHLLLGLSSLPFQVFNSFLS